jgi:hypothetical protein
LIDYDGVLQLHNERLRAAYDIRGPTNAPRWVPIRRLRTPLRRFRDQVVDLTPKVWEGGECG